jgi:alpha-L-fucosidase 2
MNSHRWPCKVVFACAISLLSFSAHCTEFGQRLWYDKPATNWEKEALPIGNGRLGAMIFGGVEQEHIQFNESSLWIGDEHDTGAYQAFGDVFIDFGKKADSAVSGYRRELDIARALHAVTYVQSGVKFRREYFASQPANVIVLRFTADKPGAYSGAIKLTDMHRGKIVAGGNRIISTGSLAGYTYEDKDSAYLIALNYQAQVLVLNDGGSVQAINGVVAFDHVNQLTVLLDAGTDYSNDHRRGWRGENPRSGISSRLKSAAGKECQALLAEHVVDYQKLFSRVSFTLVDSGSQLPTDQRLLKYSEGVHELGFESLVFQYGRYLFISSSRDTLPANLQGLWNNSNRPPWRSDYHTDINVQMNYWIADVANLSECFLPYAVWLNSIREVRMAETRAAFGTRGWTMHAENGVFGGSTWEWIESGSAWCMQNIWDHYEFTLDKDYLKKLAYPMMKGVCEYWIDRLKTMPDGTLVAPNGFSPEHGPREDGVSHDQQLIWDVFNNTAEAAGVLGIDTEFRAELLVRRDKLLAPKIGKWGQLQEWMVDRDDPKDDHRHVSHMVAVYPGHQISPRTTPQLAEAARVSLNARGDVSTGWSTAWKINLWARLHDGDRAYKLMGNLLRPVGDTRMNYVNGGGLYANLFDAHPPFQIDGNFGYTAGVCEMLLQSHTPEIELLPALPRAWPAGKVTGLRARGNLEVDIEWRDGKLLQATFHPRQDTKVKVRYGERCEDLQLKAGQAALFK